MRSPGPRHMSGLSLVELMIAIALGAFIIAAVTHIYLSSSQTHRNTEALSRIQENGRFAIDFISRELRHAGYWPGCRNGEPHSLLATSDDLRFTPSPAIIGWGPGEAQFLTNNYVADFDAILIKHVAHPSTARPSGNTPANANAINLDGASGVARGAIVLASDGLGCDLFQNANVPSANSLARGAGSGMTPGNVNPGQNDFSQAYGPDAEIHTLRSVIFYVGTSTDGNGTALRRRRFDEGPMNSEELITGVSGLYFCYGEDTDVDGQADRWAAAGNVSQWEDIVSVRATVIVTSEQANLAPQNHTISFLGCDGSKITQTVPERRLAQVFTTTIGLRNRLP